MEKDIKSQLIKDWIQMIATGEISNEEMHRSLQEQIDGDFDLSADEYCIEYAQIMGDGWEEDLTDEQIDIWRDIVNEAARKYLAM